VLELENELKSFDVRFVTLKGIVEVVPRKLNKGLIVKKVLRDISRTHPDPIDFILCMGDDISDEKMFTSVFSFVAEMGDEVHSSPDPPVVGRDGNLESYTDWAQIQTRISDPLYCYACAVGKKPSHASFYVNDTQEVADGLILLAKGSEGGPLSASWRSAGNSSMFT
jgi:trehalose 6-phosphate synthase/phosphatase